jgi:hypothetical protein
LDAFAGPLVDHLVGLARVLLGMADEERVIDPSLKEKFLIVKLHPHRLPTAFGPALIDQHLPVGVNDEASF